MKTVRSTIVLCCFALTVGGTDIAQGRPDQAVPPHPNLSGTWTTVRGTYEGRGNQNVSGLRIGPNPSSRIITQDSESVTVVERYSVFPDNKVVYRLGGQTARNQFRLGVEIAPSETTSRWQDNKLVSSITVFAPQGSPPLEYQQTLSLDPTGLLLVRDEDGFSNSRTVTYQKTGSRTLDLLLAVRPRGQER